MKNTLVALCLISAATAWGSAPGAAAPVIHPPPLACSTQGFTGPSVMNLKPDTPVKCWSAPVTCPAGWHLVENGTDLGGHPATWIGYDAGQRAFFYTCAPTVKQPPPK